MWDAVLTYIAVEDDEIAVYHGAGRCRVRGGCGGSITILSLHYLFERVECNKKLENSMFTMLDLRVFRLFDDGHLIFWQFYDLIGFPIKNSVI
jgi:hypothetical protein